MRECATGEERAVVRPRGVVVEELADGPGHALDVETRDISRVVVDRPLTIEGTVGRADDDRGVVGLSNGSEREVDVAREELVEGLPPTVRRGVLVIEVVDEDKLSKNDFIAFAALPLTSLREGYHRVNLSHLQTRDSYKNFGVDLCSQVLAYFFRAARNFASLM